MVNLSRFLEPYAKAGAFNSLLAPVRFVDDCVFLTRGNGLGIAISVAGIDYESLTDEALESHTKRAAAAWRGFGEDFRIYQYLLKQDRAEVGIERAYQNPAVSRTVNERNEYLGSKGLYSIRLVYAVVCEPSVNKSGERISAAAAARVMAMELARNSARLRGRVESFLRQAGDLLGLRIMDKRETFAFLRLLLNLDPQAASAERLKHDAHIDYYLPSQAICCERDGIRLGDIEIEVLSMREQPRETFPNLLRDLLRIGASFILCTEFKRAPTDCALSTVRLAQKHHYWSQWISDIPAILSMVVSRGKRDNVIADKSATNDVAELDSVITRINNNGEYLGEFSFTAILYGRNGRTALQCAVSDAIRSFGNHEGSLVVESYNALNAYLSIIPGNTAFNVRRSWLLSANYADLSFLYAPSSGARDSGHLAAEYLVTLETDEQTPYYFNLHTADRQGSLVLGAPGSGKSVLANLIIDHSQKYSPRTFILDIGGSYREITRKHGGSYLHMRFGAHQSFRINPFSLASTKENLAFLFNFVKLLLIQGGYPMSAVQEVELYDAVKGMYVLRAEQRTLGNLVAGLPRSMATYLRSWVAGGQFETVFDNTEDTLTFAEFQTFDFQGLDELYEPVMEPLLFYILQRFSAVVYDPALSTTPKQLWADEVWKFLANERARQYLLGAGLTWRKHNGGIGLITQSADSLRVAGVLDVINEICPMKLLLANPGANLSEYQKMFGLNAREVELFSALIPKRQFLMKTPTASKVLNVDLDPRAFWEYANSPLENQRRQEAVAKLGAEEGLRILADQTSSNGNSSSK
jgi:type IV secretion/conjugal transfer VirB4 family ATPase